MIKVLAGLILGLLIGSACRWFDIPLPGPPKLVGALLIVSITVGYLATDKLIAAKFSSKALLCDEGDVRRPNRRCDFPSCFLRR